MSVVDATMTREVLREIGKRPVDISGLDVHVTHGVAYLRGRLDRVRGYYEDLDIQAELTIIVRVLRQKPGIRDVICEVETGGLTIRQRLAQKRARHDY